MAILVTGGTGFIGSHTVVELLSIGKEVVIVDNLSNSKISVLDRIEAISGIRPKFYHVDLLDYSKTEEIFLENDIEAVIHFAGLKAVGESVSMPIEYYENNLMSTLNVLRLMRKYKVRKIVFSSSATVYGLPKYVPITEDFPLSTTNPYGETKLMIERILADVCVAEPWMSVAILRYFNPIGAHKSGLIGEDPQGIPNNLLPYVSKVAAGKLECLTVHGDDYDTPDGTGVRDYIHVVDLALAHLKALEWTGNNTGVDYFNVGTGNGYSVLEIVKAYEKASGKTVNYKIGPRRPGDIGECYANPEKALNVLGWKAERGIEEMCVDLARWQEQNPDGFPND
ncbi:MAG: UDP-glucose 4-epimerase GalE [Ruminococcaceae bacterium]|nr:UDP-glucose 4-epimerase GalE [Oscillospiraceae bacterium]